MVCENLTCNLFKDPSLKVVEYHQTDIRGHTEEKSGGV